LSAYNYFVDHDVTWGYLGVAYIDQHSCDYAQEILSQGLEKIYHLSRASTYEQLHKLLSLGEDRWNEPGFATWFLDRGLECGANWVPLIPDALSLLDDEDGDFVIGRPFYDDSDPGPTSMWEWVYRDDLAGEVVASSRYIAHRQWGFPFWNSSRLRDALLLGNPDIPGPIKSNELGLEAYSTPERLEALKESQKLRSAIWSKEGTGFFSRQDQTKIVWPKPSRPEKKCSELPRALEEAKKSLVLSIDETGVECIVIQQI
jgi:hypothetical protein